MCWHGIKYICTFPQLQLMNPLLSIPTCLTLSYNNVPDSVESSGNVPAQSFNTHHEYSSFLLILYDFPLSKLSHAKPSAYVVSASFVNESDQSLILFMLLAIFLCILFYNIKVT